MGERVEELELVVYHSCPIAFAYLELIETYKYYEFGSESHIDPFLCWLALITV